MRLSHKRKVAHKRSGAAKGWAREVFRAASVAVAADWARALESETPALPVYADKPKPSLIARGVSLVKGAFSRLKEAGEAQRNLLQGRQ